MSATEKNTHRKKLFRFVSRHIAMQSLERQIRDVLPLFFTIKSPRRERGKKNRQNEHKFRIESVIDISDKCELLLSVIFHKVGRVFSVSTFRILAETHSIKRNSPKYGFRAGEVRDN